MKMNESMHQSSHRYAVDLYGMNEANAEEISRVERLLQGIKSDILGYRGITQVIPVLSESVKPEDRGISGLIIAPMRHFTIHTFSWRGVTFIDLFSRSVSCSEVQESLRQTVRENLGDCAFVNCTADSRPGFGTHRYLRLENLTYHNAMELTSAIVEVIGMHPLAECLSLVGNAGYDILQPITESHIAIHSNNAGTWLDVFSCKPFSETRLARIVESFGVRILEESGFTRGAQTKQQT